MPSAGTRMRGRRVVAATAPGRKRNTYLTGSPALQTRTGGVVGPPGQLQWAGRRLDRFIDREIDPAPPAARLQQLPALDKDPHGLTVHRGGPPAAHRGTAVHRPDRQRRAAGAVARGPTGSGADLLSRVPPVHQSAVHSPPRPNRRLAAAAQMRPPHLRQPGRPVRQNLIRIALEQCHSRRITDQATSGSVYALRAAVRAGARAYAAVWEIGGCPAAERPAAHSDHFSGHGWRPWRRYGSGCAQRCWYLAHSLPPTSAPALINPLHRSHPLSLLAAIPAMVRPPGTGAIVKTCG